MGIVNEWRIGYYISFATQFTLIFGLSFELPVVVMTLVKIGILNWEMMRHTRGYAVLAIFVVAAVREAWIKLHPQALPPDDWAHFSEPIDGQFTPMMPRK
jgi:hypothetical protein